MNKKTKTMFVVQPGGFGSGTAIFSSYEFENNSDAETEFAPLADRKPAPARQMIETGFRTNAMGRLSQVLRRSVWQPLSRRVQKLGSAA